MRCWFAVAFVGLLCLCRFAVVRFGLLSCVFVLGGDVRFFGLLYLFDLLWSLSVCCVFRFTVVLFGLLCFFGLMWCWLAVLFRFAVVVLGLLYVFSLLWCVSACCDFVGLLWSFSACCDLSVCCGVVRLAVFVRFAVVLCLQFDQICR